MSARIHASLALFLLSATLHSAAAQDAPKSEPAKVAPPYATAHKKPLDAKDEIVNTAEDHTQFRVEFNGIKNDRVPAYLYVPKSTSGPLPAVLLQYGSGGNKKTDYIVAIGKQFVARGFIVLTIDAPNTGERRDKDPKSVGLLGLAGNDQIMQYCGDYSRAIDYLGTRPDVDKDRIGYVGISWGAITGITFVAYDDRVKAMGSMVGGGNFVGLYSPKMAEKNPGLGAKSGDPVYHIARIAPRPLLLLNVTKDQLILKSWAESLHQAAGVGAKVMWLECDHYFRGVDRAAACETVIDFMAKSMPAKGGEKGE
jgi:dienelactone hydrolase